MMNALDMCTFVGKAIWSFEMSILSKINQMIMDAFITIKGASEEQDNGTSSGIKRKIQSSNTHYKGIFHMHLLEVYELFKQVHADSRAANAENPLLSDSVVSRSKIVRFDAKRLNQFIGRYTDKYAKDTSDFLKRYLSKTYIKLTLLSLLTYRCMEGEEFDKLDEVDLAVIAPTGTMQVVTVTLTLPEAAILKMLMTRKWYSTLGQHETVNAINVIIDSEQHYYVPEGKLQADNHPAKSDQKPERPDDLVERPQEVKEKDDMRWKDFEREFQNLSKFCPTYRFILFNQASLGCKMSTSKRVKRENDDNVNEEEKEEDERKSKQMLYPNEIAWRKTAKDLADDLSVLFNQNNGIIFHLTDDLIIGNSNEFQDRQIANRNEIVNWLNIQKGGKCSCSFSQ